MDNIETADPSKDDEDTGKYITNQQTKSWKKYMDDNTKHSGKGYSLDSVDGKIKDVVYVSQNGCVA